MAIRLNSFTTKFGAQHDEMNASANHAADCGIDRYYTRQDLHITSPRSFRQAAHFCRKGPKGLLSLPIAFQLSDVVRPDVQMPHMDIPNIPNTHTHTISCH